MRHTPSSPHSPSVTYWDAILFFLAWFYFLLFFSTFPQLEIRLSFLINSAIGVIFWHEYFHFTAATAMSLLLGAGEKDRNQAAHIKNAPGTFSYIFQILAVLYLFLFPSGLLLGYLPLTLELHWTFFLSPPGLMFCEFMAGSFLDMVGKTGKDEIGIRFLSRINSLTVNVPMKVFFKKRWARAIITGAGPAGSLFLGAFFLLNPGGAMNHFFQPDNSPPSFATVAFASACLHIVLGLSTFLLGLIPLRAFRFQDGAAVLEKWRRREAAFDVENGPEEIIKAGKFIRKMRALEDFFDKLEHSEANPDKTIKNIMDGFAKLIEDASLDIYDPHAKLRKDLEKIIQKNTITIRIIKRLCRRFDDIERRMRTVHPNLMAVVRPHPENPWRREIDWEGLEWAPGEARAVLTSLEQTLDSGDRKKIEETIAAIPGVMRLAVSEVPKDILSKSLKILAAIMAKGPGGPEIMKAIFISFYLAAGYAEELETDQPPVLKRGIAVKIGLIKDAGGFKAEDFQDLGESLRKWAFH